MFSKETVYTSTGEKFLKHLDVLEKFQKMQLGTPLVMHIMPTSRCNLKCVFCSVKDRKKNEELDFKGTIKPTVEKLKKRGLKAVIISGGGEPTLYPKFAELVNFLADIGLQVGLITNGTRFNEFNKELFERLTWIRISINSLDYLDDIAIPKLVNPTLGFSYIMNEKTTEESLRKIKEYALRHGAKYVRLLPDCAQPTDQLLEEHKKLARIVEELGEPFFHQFKVHGTPESCYLGYFHPVLYCDGNIYPCDSLVLNDFENQQFKETFKICRAADVDKFYDEKVRSLVDPKKMCPYCVFERQNRLLMSVLESMDHENFV